MANQMQAGSRVSNGFLCGPVRYTAMSLAWGAGNMSGLQNTAVTKAKSGKQRQTNTATMNTTIRGRLAVCIT